MSDTPCGRIIKALAKIVLLHDDDKGRIPRDPVMEEVQHIRDDAYAMQRELAEWKAWAEAVEGELAEVSRMYERLNAAAGSGGHCSVASDSQESPGAGHCQPAAPDADAQEVK